MVRWIKLIIALAVPQLVGLLGVLFTRTAIASWYAALAKPSFTPPSRIFGLTWTALYLLMGIAAYIVWTSDAEGKWLALIIFCIQLFLNLLWTILFFGLRSPLAGMIEMVLLWLAILATIILFFRISAAAGALLLPYIAWVSFAAALNYGIWRMNA
jgi:tryptophan-rich sensory protein